MIEVSCLFLLGVWKARGSAFAAGLNSLLFFLLWPVSLIWGIFFIVYLEVFYFQIIDSSTEALQVSASFFTVGHLTF